MVKLQNRARFPSAVAPPFAQGIRWWTWQTDGGCSQPGKRHFLSRWMTALRRWEGMVRVVRPRSSGWDKLVNRAGSRWRRR